MTAEKKRKKEKRVITKIQAPLEELNKTKIMIHVFFLRIMPLGPFGEVVGTTGTLEALGPDAQNYKTKVIAPRNPKLVKKHEEHQHKVS